MIYTSKEGDVLDAIALDYYGSTEGTVEEILRANRELAFAPPVLPTGVVIELPEISLPYQENKKIRLWD